MKSPGAGVSFLHPFGGGICLCEIAFNYPVIMVLEICVG
jgi:hypothetical protein